MFFHRPLVHLEELNCMTNSMEEQGQDILHLKPKRMQYVQQRPVSEP